MEKDIGSEIRRIDHAISVYFKKTNGGCPGDGFIPRMSFFVLGYIMCAEKTVYQKDIEENFRIKHSTATELLLKLEEEGYIKRIRSSSDARLKEIIITPKTAEIAENMKNRKKETEKIMRMDIEAEELDVFFRVIDKICNNLENNA